MRLKYDLKRIFADKILLVSCVLAPVVVLLLFSLIFVPMLAVSGDAKFSIAICNEDQNSPETAVFISQYVNSQALKDVVRARDTDDYSEAVRLLEDGKVSVIIHVPAGLYSGIEEGRPGIVRLVSREINALELSIVEMTLSSSLSVVSQGQNMLAAAEQALIEKEIYPGSYYDDAFMKSVYRFMNRRAIVGEVGAASALSNFLPIEYYMGAIYAIFAALSMLPLIRITTADASGPVLRRGLLRGENYIRFFIIRVVAGTIFIVLVLSTLLPVTLLLRYSGTLLGSFEGNGLMLIAFILTTAFCFSALAAAIGFWLPSDQPALWIGFYLILFMAVTGGALFPVGALPPAAAEIGRWLPLRSVMQLISAALFRVKDAVFADWLRLFVSSILFFSLGLVGARRRGGF